MLKLNPALVYCGIIAADVAVLLSLSMYFATNNFSYQIMGVCFSPAQIDQI